MSAPGRECFGLYLVLTDPVAGHQACAEAAVAEGVRYLQLRMKGRPRHEVAAMARRLAAVTRGSATRLIVNDDPWAAAEAGADGVHVGQGDLPVRQAREAAGGARLLGLSTHNGAQAAAAALQGPDYIGVGPVFATPTKAVPDPVLGVEGAAAIIRASPLTCVAIGGLNPGNLPDLLGRGVDNFAVVRHVCQSQRPRDRICELMRLWRQARSA